MGHALDSMVCAGVVISGAACAAAPCSVHLHSFAESSRRDPVPGRRRRALGGRPPRDPRQGRARARGRLCRRRSRRGPRARVHGLLSGDGWSARRGGGAVKVAPRRRVPARRLRRGRGPRRVPGARARALEELTVHAGEDRDGVVGHRAWDVLAGGQAGVVGAAAMSIDLSMTAGAQGAELVHLHTWYANFGHLSKLTYDIPHVATVHRSSRCGPGRGAARRRLHALCRCEKVALESAGRGDRGLRGHALRRVGGVPGAGRLEGARDLQRHRRGAVRARHRDRRAGAVGCLAGRAVGRLRGPITRQKGVPTSSRRRSWSTRRCASCCARARPTRPRSPPRCVWASTGSASSAAG